MMETIRKKIEQKIRNALQPVHLEIINESYRHAVARGSETHFKIIIVTDEFTGQPLIERHRSINRLLAEELAGSIHALALRTMTSEEWQAGNAGMISTPACLGGSKKS